MIMLYLCLQNIHLTLFSPTREEHLFRPVLNSPSYINIIDYIFYVRMFIRPLYIRQGKILLFIILYSPTVHWTKLKQGRIKPVSQYYFFFFFFFTFYFYFFFIYIFFSINFSLASKWCFVHFWNNVSKFILLVSEWYIDALSTLINLEARREDKEKDPPNPEINKH